MEPSETGFLQVIIDTIVVPGYYTQMAFHIVYGIICRWRIRYKSP